MVAMCREGWNYLLIPSQRRLRGYRALSAGGFAVAVVRSPPNLWCRWWSSGGRLNACETLVCALATVSVLATVQGLSSSRLVLAAAGSSVVRAAVFGYSSNKFLRINEDGPLGKGECISLLWPHQVKAALP